MKMVLINPVKDRKDARRLLTHISMFCKDEHFGRVVKHKVLVKGDNRTMATVVRTTGRKYRKLVKSRHFYIPVKGVLFPMKGGF